MSTPAGQAARAQLPLSLVVVSAATGAGLARRLGQTVGLTVAGEPAAGRSVNVSARLHGAGSTWLTVAARLDSPAGAPGAGIAGIAAVLELARRLRGWSEPASLVLLLDGSRTAPAGSSGATAWYARREVAAGLLPWPY